MYKASAGDAFRINDGSCECGRSQERVNEGRAGPHNTCYAKVTPSKTRDLSCVLLPTRLPDEQNGRLEKLRKVQAELKIDLISVKDSIQHQLVGVLARLLDAFAVDDEDVGHTTLIEYQIEAGNRIPFGLGLHKSRTRVAFFARESSIEWCP